MTTSTKIISLKICLGSLLGGTEVISINMGAALTKSDQRNMQICKYENDTFNEHITLKYDQFLYMVELKLWA